MTTTKNTSTNSAEFAYSHLALTADVIEKNAKYIRTASKTVAERAHSTAVAVLIRSMPMSEGGHLDCSLALTLFASMHDGMRRQSLVKWFEKYSNIRFSSHKGKDDKITFKVSLIGPTHDDYKNAHPLLANVEPFWKLVAVEGPAVILHDADFAKALASLVKRFTEEGKADLSEANVKRIESLKNMASAAMPKANDNGKTTAKIEDVKASVGSAKPKGEPRSFAPSAQAQA